MDAKELERLEALNQEGTQASMADQSVLLRALLYGDPGAGKTDLAAAICRVLGGKNCLIYADSAWTTVLKYRDVAANTMKYKFGGFSMIRTIIKARKEGVEPYCSFNNLIWDTWSSSLNMVLRNLVTRDKFPKEQYHKDIEVRGHYRLLEAYLKEIIDELNDTDLNIIYTAHLRSPNEDDKKNSKLAVRPSAPEASFRVVAQETNLIGYLYKEESGGQRLIQLSGTRTETAKCQLPGIEERTYPVDEIPKLIQKWREDYVNLG